jgi:hypothetical protein
VKRVEQVCRPWNFVPKWRVVFAQAKSVATVLMNVQVEGASAFLSASANIRLFSTGTDRGHSL